MIKHMWILTIPILVESLVRCNPNLLAIEELMLEIYTRVINNMTADTLHHCVKKSSAAMAMFSTLKNKQILVFKVKGLWLPSRLLWRNAIKMQIYLIVPQNIWYIRGLKKIPSPPQQLFPHVSSWVCRSSGQCWVHLDCLLVHRDLISCWHWTNSTWIVSANRQSVTNQGPNVTVLSNVVYPPPP